MRFTSTFTAALAMASIAIAAPAPKADAAPEEAFKRSVGYQLLTGDGSNWPGMGAWTDFETMYYLLLLFVNRSFILILGF